MYRLSFDTVQTCISKAVPSIDQHLSKKLQGNTGFTDNPKAILPVTKLLTLGLDKKTRQCIESQIIDVSGLTKDEAIRQIQFIRACMLSVNYSSVCSSVEDDSAAEDMWTILDGLCCRDGALFLQWIDSVDGPEKSIAEKFVHDTIVACQ